MYTQGTTEKTDPEGLLSTLPAIVTALLGYWAGLVIQRRGATLANRRPADRRRRGVAAVGLAWDQVASHQQETLDQQLRAAHRRAGDRSGLRVCLAVFDVLGLRRLARPFEIVGVNAIIVFVGAGLLARLLRRHTSGAINAAVDLSRKVFTDHIADPKLASLGFALTTVAFWWLIAWAMARRGWTLRV